MSNKEEKYKEHKKKNKYIVKDKDGNILPIDIPDEFMDGLRAMPVSYTHLTLPTILRV